MWTDTPFTRMVGCRVPIVGAPMAGGPSTPALVAAISGAGGFGVLGCGYDSPDAIRDAIRAVRAATDAPFGVNLFVPGPYDVDDALVADALRRLAPLAAELGVELTMPTRFAEDFDAQLAVVLAERVAMFSFTFGIPSAEVLAALRDAGTLTCGTATHVAEARALVEVGVDMVCVQGAEAGGHRGTFLGTPEDVLVGTMALVPSVCDAVDVPVIAGGGIADGRGVAAVLALGASAAALGTAFLRCPEAGTSAPYRAAVSAAGETDTVITRALSGRAARGIGNRITDALAGVDLPPYPVMNALTRELRRACTAAGRSDFLSLWAGQGAGAARDRPAAELLGALSNEAGQAADS